MATIASSSTCSFWVKPFSNTDFLWFCDKKSWFQMALLKMVWCPCLGAGLLLVIIMGEELLIRMAHALALKVLSTQKTTTGFNQEGLLVLQANTRKTSLILVSFDGSLQRLPSIASPVLLFSWSLNAAIKFYQLPHSSQTEEISNKMTYAASVPNQKIPNISSNAHIQQEDSNGTDR